MVRSSLTEQQETNTPMAKKKNKARVAKAKVLKDKPKQKPTGTALVVVPVADDIVAEATAVQENSTIEPGPTTAVPTTESEDLLAAATLGRNDPPAVDAEFTEVGPRDDVPPATEAELVVAELTNKDHPADVLFGADSVEQISIREFLELEWKRFTDRVSAGFDQLSKLVAEKYGEFESFRRSSMEPVDTWVAARYAEFSTWAVAKDAEFQTWLGDVRRKAEDASAVRKAYFRAISDTILERLGTLEQTLSKQNANINKRLTALEKLSGGGASAPEPVSVEKLMEFAKAVSEGRKVNATHLLRELSGCSLNDAREALSEKAVA